MARSSKTDDIDLVGHRNRFAKAVTQKSAVYKPYMVKRIRNKEFKARDGKTDEIDLVGHRNRFAKAVTQKSAVYKSFNKKGSLKKTNSFKLPRRSTKLYMFFTPHG